MEGDRGGIRYHNRLPLASVFDQLLGALVGSNRPFGILANWDSSLVVFHASFRTICLFGFGWGVASQIGFDIWPFGLRIELEEIKMDSLADSGLWLV